MLAWACVRVRTLGNYTSSARWLCDLGMTRNEGGLGRRRPDIYVHRL